MTNSVTKCHDDVTARQPCFAVVDFAPRRPQPAASFPFLLFLNSTWKPIGSTIFIRHLRD